MGHEYCGIVEEVGSAVKSVKLGQFVIGSFATSDNTCPTASTATSRRASSASSSARHKRQSCAFRSRTGRWCQRRAFRRRTYSRAY
jgi:Zn-dependent alcohol dehydrogenase